MTRPFVDVVDLIVHGGDGGDGCVSFRSEPYNPKGGPDGGDGGQGGNVVIEAKNGISTLAELNYESEIEAEPGGDGGPKNQHGSQGRDNKILVPEGTEVYNHETDEYIGELTEDGDDLTVVSGGEGGRGNRCFANSQRQAPNFRELGSTGETKHIRLELKLIADVGLVGRPNAGKSTLLGQLTGAHPEVDNYEFTTVSPNLGVLFRDHERLTLCDIPGLIENAHEGAGLGFEFLRHVDRTKILLIMVDLSDKNPVEKYETVAQEINSYGSGLSKKPRILALNKIDLVDQEMVDLFIDEVEFDNDRIVPISARKETNLDTLKSIVWDTFKSIPDESEDDTKQEVERVIQMEQETPISVTKANGRFLLQGEKVRELVERFNLSNPDALAYVREQLLTLNLHKILEKSGCRPGDTVQVGRQVFEYTG